jgi:hypothetical protein
MSKDVDEQQSTVMPMGGEPVYAMHIDHLTAQHQVRVRRRGLTVAEP